MSVPAGRSHAGAVAGGRRQARVGPRHPGDLGLRFRSALERRTILGRGDVAAQRRYVPGADHHGDGAVVSFKALSFKAWRMARRICASRRASRRAAADPLTASPVSARSVVIASAMAAKTSRAAPRLSISAFQSASPSAWPEASARRSSGSTSSGDSSADGGAPGSSGVTAMACSGATACCSGGRRDASDIAAGQSMKRTGRPCRSAQRMACHSGENTANGKKTDKAGSSAA